MIETGQIAIAGRLALTVAAGGHAPGAELD
jgi:hypothetical protein